MDDSTELIAKLLKENEALKRENNILSVQLALKERHLDLILQHATLALAAFNKEGIMELNVGNGLIVNTDQFDVSQYHQLLFTLSNQQLEDMIPHIMKAVRIAREQKIITRAETNTPSGKLFHSIFVPYLDSAGEVELVYGIAIRWPDEMDINTDYLFKGSVNLPKLPSSEN